MPPLLDPRASSSLPTSAAHTAQVSGTVGQEQRGTCKRPAPLPLEPHRPAKRPQYGHDPTGKLNRFEDEEEEYYEDDEDLDVDEAIAEQEEYEDEEGEGGFTVMAEMWPSSEKNRLAEPFVRPDGTVVTVEPDDPRLSALGLPLSLPYNVETLAEMDDRLELIVQRLVECVKAREWGLGFRTWDAALSTWMSMGYLMKRDIKIKLIFMYYEILFVPGLGGSFVDDAGNQLITLLSDRTLSIWDFRIPWRPLYDALFEELFPHPSRLNRHSFNLAPTFLNVAETAQRFFHPADMDEMLEVMLPKFEPSMDSILATQAFLVHFLPISHPQRWLPLIFRLWSGFNSGLWDDQASDLLGQLAIAHNDPGKSDPSIIAKIPKGTFNTPEEQEKNPMPRRSYRLHKQRLLEIEGEVVESEDGLTYWFDQSKLPEDPRPEDSSWQGIRRDIGIFSEQEFEFLMSKCLRSLNVPVGGSIASSNAMSITSADTRVSKKVIDAKKPIDRVQSLAEIIIYSMAEDAPVAASTSATATPGTSTPVNPAVSRLQNGGTSMKRSASADSLAAAGKKSDADSRMLAGCKALDHLSRLLTSCETFFHPSNSGHWSAFLTAFLSHLAHNFVERWTSEQEPTCRTPVAWRLTPEIKKDFVLCLRPLALTAIFNKDMDSVTPAVSTLKKLSVLEPDLIMPPMIERIVPSLQGLEETGRTPAVTYALAALAQPLAARQLWRMGGMYVVDIFSLLLPGIDLNDPAKTGLSCMAISNMVDFIRIGDIADFEDNSAKGSRALRTAPRPPAPHDPDETKQEEEDKPDMSEEDVNSAVRMATSAFRDWVPEFLGRVLLLFSNLPEEGGKSGKAGGKTEQLTLQSVLHTCGGVFAAMDEKLFDQALEQVAEYAMNTTRSNAVDAVGELVRNMSATRADKVFAKLFPVCKSRIAGELKGGASSMRTQTTSIPRASDAALHWWQSILYGMLIPGRLDLSSDKWRKDYLDLLRLLIDSTLTERGWIWTGKLVEKSVSCLTSIYFREMSMLEVERDSDDLKLNHHYWWGKLYRATEIKPQWRVPSEQDISMALDMLGIADDQLAKLNALIKDRQVGDKVWSNEFCRAINVIDKTLRGSYNLIAEIGALKEGGIQADSPLPAETLQLLPPYKSGLVLTDPDDPRYQQVAAFRARVGETLHAAASGMRDAGESDNSVESVRILVTTIGTFLTAYGIRNKQFTNAQNAYSAMITTKRMFESQRKQHRTIFMAAASVHSQNRLVTLAHYRKRSSLDDKLIRNLLDFALSPFTRIRRSSQSTLETAVRMYRGCWVLFFPLIFDALQPGTDPDRMKGALYVLRYNAVGIARMSRDWQYLVQLTECLLNAHHENKASVQSLVSKATDELIAYIKEPTSFGTMDVRTDKLDVAVASVESWLDEQHKPNQSTVEAIRAGMKEQKDIQDREWNVFIDRVLAIAKDTTLNWRYVLAASRFLYCMTRRDQPTDLRLAKFFAENVQNPHPRIRDFGTVGLTRMLFHIALRSLCEGSEERLFLQEPIDPFAKTIQLDDTSAGFTRQYLDAFRSDLPEKEETALLQDRLDTGWLVWGKEMETSRLSAWDETAWKIDESCRPGLTLIQGVMSQDGWWQQLADHWAREDTRNYPSANHIDFILACVQLYGMDVVNAITPIVDKYLAEMDATKVYDRHKIRAMFEFISGLLRGTEELPGRDRKAFWNWLTPKLPELFGIIRHDTTKCWDISIEYVLNDRDPRRYKPLVDFCISTALEADFQSGSAFGLARRVQLIRSVLRCLQWRFNAWCDDFIDFYFRSITCQYAEVRGLVASVLNALEQMKFHPSFTSAAALNETILADPEQEKDIMRIRSGTFEPQLDEVLAKLPEWKAERPHGPKAVLSDHDNAATTTLTWLSVALSDVHAAAAFPYIIPILPQIFELRDLNDNPDLQRTAGRMLAMITSITPSLELIEPLMEKLLFILQNAASWKTKIHSMPVLSLVYFRNLSLLSETCKAKCLDVVSSCLRDPNQEVREMASSTLSGFLRCSQRAMVEVLKDRFTRELKATQLPKRRAQPGQINPEYQETLVRLHGAVLGATALVEAFPYTIPKFLPKLLAEVLAPRVSEPAPISTTIRGCVASFKRTHEKYQDRFTEDELSAMNYAQAGNSYYA